MLGRSFDFLFCSPHRLVFLEREGRHTVARKMLFSNLLQTALLSLATLQTTSARAIAGKPQNYIQPYRRGEPLQDIVTWDEHSLLIRGERVMLYSGEFHPFRLPVRPPETRQWLSLQQD